MLLACLGAHAPSDAAPRSRAAAMREAAVAFLSTLEGGKRAAAARPWSDPGRERWSGFPGARAGIAWRDLDASQRKAAVALLRTGLGERGLEMFDGIRVLEGVLRRQEAAAVRRNPDWRHPGLYHLAVFGSPTPKLPWGWRLEGHHLSWNFTLAGERIAITPRFQGADPATAQEPGHAGLRVLGPEEDAARRVVAGLDAARRGRAVLSARVPALPSPRGDPDLTRARRRGIPLAELTAPQQALVWSLLEAWAAALHPELAKREIRRAKARNPGRLHFAWMGSTRAGAPCWFRLHGDTVHIEYGRSGHHVHSVWRDPRGVFAPAVGSR